MSGNGHGKLTRSLTFGLFCLLCTGGILAQDNTRKVLRKVTAQYPAILKQRGIGGVVKLRVLVNQNGTVKDTVVLGGNPILANCAQKAVKQWVFAPGIADSEMEISIVFDPNSQQE
jgi:TonB family protein